MNGARGWTLFVAVMGAGIVFLDGTVVTVALPSIARDLGSVTGIGALEAQSYVYNAYLLTLAALLIPFGVIIDARGRRRMFTIGLVGFGVTSALCGLAPSMELLILGRILQGAAGAVLVPGSLALITAAFDGEDRARAFGIWAGASAAISIVAPLIGGVLVDALSWRAAFLVNIPLLAVALWATLAHAAESRDPNATGRLDWVGAVLSALAVGGLTFGPIRGQERQWEDPLAWVSLALGILSSVAFVVWMRRARDPLVPPSLFRSRTFTVVNLSTFVIYGALYVVLYLLTIHVQGTLGYNATAAGLATIPAMVMLALFSARVGKWAGRVGPRAFLTVGPATMAVGVLLLGRIPATSSAWVVEAGDPSTWGPPDDYLVHVLPGVLVFGIGVMVMVAPLTAALMSSVPVTRAGLASAFNNAVSRIGPQLAGAAIFVAVTAAFYAGVAERVPDVDTGSAEVRTALAPLNAPSPDVPQEVAVAAREASAEAFSVAMWIAAALLAAGAVINGVGIREEVPVEVAAERLAGQLCMPLQKGEAEAA